MLRDAVWHALGTVLDPELDEPITALDFVASCTVSGDGVAVVRLRLPDEAAPAHQEPPAQQLAETGQQ